eukprot:747317-Pelagomonas_calceolata.AAC.5
MQFDVPKFLISQWKHHATSALASSGCSTYAQAPDPKWMQRNGQVVCSVNGNGQGAHEHAVNSAVICSTHFWRASLCLCARNRIPSEQLWDPWQRCIAPETM